MRGLLGNAGRMAGQMTVDRMGQNKGAGAKSFAPEAQPQRRGLMDRVGGFLNNERGGVSNLDRIGLAAAFMRDDPAFALAAQQGIADQRAMFDRRQEIEQGRRNQGSQAKLQDAQEQQARREEIQRVYALEDQFGLDRGSLAMLPADARDGVISELAARRFTPEEPEPNLREFGDTLYDLSDLNNPRPVLRGRPGQRDRSTVTIDGRLVDSNTGEVIADFSDPQADVPNIGDFNQQQTMAAEYAARMERAGQVVDQLYQADDPETPDDDESAQNQIDPTARWRLRNLGIPGTPFEVGTAFSPDAVRQYEQAVDEFALALLRRESGAAISASEREEVARTYFPQPGDGPQTVRQKAEARRSVIEGMRRASGGAYDLMFAGGQQRGSGASSFADMSDEELERIAHGG